MADPMHDDEITVTKALVHRLLERQAPRWSRLDLTPVQSAGTDNILYRLGQRLSVRLPRTPSAAKQVSKEHRWLPNIARRVTLTTPEPLLLGTPQAGFPWSWSIYSWLPGEPATLERLADHHQAARDIAVFIHSLRSIETVGAPHPGEHNFGRGVALSQRDAATRAALHELTDDVDLDLAMAVWDSGLAAPLWRPDPVWIHGDLQSGNLLSVDGRIHAVIDFGGLAVGDPACDLMIAWNLFDRDARQSFRSAVQADDAMWRRGRVWALSVGAIALPYYRRTNPPLAGIARFALQQAIADFSEGT